MLPPVALMLPFTMCSFSVGLLVPIPTVCRFVNTLGKKADEEYGTPLIMCFTITFHFNVNLIQITFECHFQAGALRGLLNADANGLDICIIGKFKGPVWLIAGRPWRELPPIGIIPADAGGGSGRRTLWVIPLHGRTLRRVE